MTSCFVVGIQFKYTNTKFMFYKRLLLPIGSFVFALLCLLVYLSNSQLSAVVYLAVIFSLLPYYVPIWKSLLKKQLDLSFPSIVTIYLLLFLGKGTIALVFILILLLGDIFKTFVIEKVKASITDVSEKLPKTVAIRKKGAELIILISEIKIDDVLLVKSGERLASDATLISDEALLDESVVTGESKPLLKKKGEKILAGSINTGNYFEAKVLSTVQNSTLFQIQKLINEAQNDKAPLAKVVSRYAWFTTIVAFIGVIVIYFLTSNILQALSFWIAIVPVIFAIIVPFATTIGIAILAKQGILVKTSSSLENLTHGNTFLFDKTGTITRGMPEVVEIMELGKNKAEIIQIAANLEAYSNHPLAISILDEAKRQKVKIFQLNEIKTLVGQGMMAKRDNTDIFLGNTSLLVKQKIDMNPDLQELVTNREKEGMTTVFVGEGKQIVGIIFLLDKLRPEAKTLFNTLSKKGYQSIIVTGDKKEVAEKIMWDLPGTNFIANVTPEGKVDEVKRKISEGENVVMIGDGINDAPALAKANVGIAMGGKGVDMTLNAADIVLLNNDIGSIPYIIETSKNIFLIIKQDVVLATSIHIITAIFVLLGSINLIQTTMIHELSSVLILFNTLRLFYIRNFDKVKV